jgi:hypothetical protein
MPHWTVAGQTRVMRARTNDPVAAGELAACDALATVWRDVLAEAAAGR